MRPPEEILPQRRQTKTIDDLEPEVRDLIQRAAREFGELSVSLRRHDREVKNAVGARQLLCACLHVVSSWFHSDEEHLPFHMFAGSGRPASRKDLI